MQKEELLQAMAENTRGGGIVSDVEWCQNCGDVVTDDGCACAAIPKPTGVLTREQLEASCREYERLLEQKRATIEQQAQELERLKREFVNKDQIIASLAEQLAASQARCREMERDKEQAVYALGQLEEKYLQLQATLAAREARIAELEDWQKIVLGSGTEQETVIRMAANEYTKTAVQCWKDHTKKIEAERDAAVQEAGRLREVLEYYAQTAIGARAIAALKAQQAAGDSPAGQTPPNFREAP